MCRPRPSTSIPTARDPDRRWYGVYANYNTPAYNTKMIGAAALPKSYEEFAHKKEWAGKVAIDGTDFDWLKGFFQHFGEAKATQIIKGMVGTLKPVITDGHLALARSVGAGEYWLSLNNYVMLSSNVQLAGSPIEIFPLDPVILFYAGVAVNAKAKSPNAARLAANFMLSQDGQGHLAKFGRLPTRGDVRPVRPVSSSGCRRRRWCRRCSSRRTNGSGSRPSTRCSSRAEGETWMRSARTFPDAALSAGLAGLALSRACPRRRRSRAPGSIRRCSPPPRRKGR